MLRIGEDDIVTIAARLGPALEGAGIDKRRAPRTCVSLPVLIEVEGDQHSALLHDLSRVGAMIEAGVSLRPGSGITLSCGTIETRAIVVWKDQSRIGVKFLGPVDEIDIGHQVSRSAAAAARRERRQLEKGQTDVVLVLPEAGQDARSEG